MSKSFNSNPDGGASHVFREQSSKPASTPSLEDVPSNVAASHGDGLYPVSTESTHVNTVVTDDEPQRPTGVVGDHESHHGDPAATNMRLLREVKTLQQRLLELEREARPNLDAKALEAEWERATERLGSEEEMKAWKEEMRQRKAGLVAINDHQPQSQWSHIYHNTARSNLDEKFGYNLRLFRIRKKWERSIGRLVDSDDSDSDQSLDVEEDFRFNRNLLRQNFDREMEALERDAYNKTRRLQRRRLAEEERHAFARMHEIVDEAPSEAVAKIAEEVVNLDARSELIRVPWDQFKALRGLQEGQSASIDVLIGEPVIEFNLGAYRGWLPEKGRKTETNPTQEMKTVTTVDVQVPGKEPMPERIRVNSRHLLRILSNIHGSAGDFSAGSLLLLRPFRILDYYNEAIREWYKRLERRFEKGLPSGYVLNSRSETSPGPTGANNEDGDAAQEKAVSTEPSSNSEPEEKEGREEDGKNLQAEEEGKGGKEGGGGDEDEKDNNAESPVAFEHLKRLVEFMDKDMQIRISHLESGSSQKVVFSDLWYLFQPGVLVIRNDGKQAYRVLSMRSVGHRVIDPLRKWYRPSLAKEDEEEAPIAITCVYLDFDGKQLGPVSEVFRMPRFEREKLVTSLEIYPLQFHPFRKDKAASETANPGAGFKKYLADRGRMFLKVAAIRLAAIQPMYYAGPALKTQDDIESQVVVDFEAAFGIEEHIQKGWRPDLKTLIGSEGGKDEDEGKKKTCDADCCTSELVHNDSYVETKRNEEFMGHLLPKAPGEMPSVVIVPRPLDAKAPEAGLTEDDLVIISYRVFGFVLRNRKWAQLDLTHLSEAQPSKKEDRGNDKIGEGSEEPKTAFDDLVLPHGHKDMILSLITQHFRDKETSHNDQADIVRGKGKGLILLLHGAPGVGKTTTAEGVAQKFKKPLFQLTCGDLGTTAKDVESALETNFALANRWGCILLLDEADVFLAQRTKEDFKRNGLVAVFLRVLEYYAGILFLTTNRVGDFDEAFASRIHISLYYPELREKETMDVFTLNLKLIGERFEGKNRKFIPDIMGIGSFARNYYDKNPFDRWNGRQIRNACQTAVALAEFEAQGKSHLVALNPNAEVRLNVSHFETVAEAYLAFSKHLRNIYGTHAARRAKEAGLRAMWVNEKGDIMGSVGPKEAGILKADRKSRFKQKTQGRYVTATNEEHPQVMVSRDQGPPYRENRGDAQGGGGQEYNGPPTRPTRPREYYDDTSTVQQHNNPAPQVPRQMGVPRHLQQQDWDSYGPGYDSYEYDQQQFEAGGRGIYPHQPSYHGSHDPKPSRGVSTQPPGIHRLPPGSHASELDEPGPRDNMEGAPYTA